MFIVPQAPRSYPINFLFFTFQLFLWHHLMTGVCSKKCVIRWFHCSVNITECMYTNPQGQPTIYLGYLV
jgi:hypothetical protein